MESTFPDTCQFPGCEEEVATLTGMCVQHSHVLVAESGSWIDAGGD